MGAPLRTGIVTDPLFSQHDPGAWHPEKPERLWAIEARLRETGLLEQLVPVALRQATREEICRIHSPAYYDVVAATDGRFVSLDPDTYTSPQSFRAALAAAGSAIELLEQVVAGDLDNGFALVRPPGHHAEGGRAMGFCLFNSIAICAEHALKVCGLRRVLIVDWDVHHGNGTMHSFYERPDVFYFSTHQMPLYPWSGTLLERGAGPGEGYTLNVPLPAGLGDVEYQAIFREVLEPAARDFKPDVILVSAGFDALDTDPIGGMKMTPQGYACLTHQVMELARECCSGRLVVLLEGGYDVEREALAVEACLRVMRGEVRPECAAEGRGLAEGIIEGVLGRGK